MKQLFTLCIICLVGAFLPILGIAQGSGAQTTRSNEVKTIKIPFKEDSSKTEYKYFVIDEAPFDRKHGTYTWYFDNGRVKAKANFRDGKKRGKWYTYQRTGVKRAEGNFANDMLNGHCKNYYQTGKLENEGEYVDGFREGVWKFYSKGGRLIKRTTFKRGEVVK